LDAGVKANADGTTDVYFGPQATSGMAAKWIPTETDGRFFLLFRFYGPEKPLFDKTWGLKMPPMGRSAIAAPMPREEPVTIATFPFALDICLLRVFAPRSCHREREHDMEVRHRQQLGRALGEPLLCCRARGAFIVFSVASLPL
jgi:hypothetical protein